MPAHPAAPEGKRSEPASAAAIDPVCGMSVVPESAAAHFDFGGTRYFFCCTACQERFVREPERYLKRSASTPNAQDAARYVCPMCAGIESPVPASCPRCGMMLEPELASPTGSPPVDPEHADFRRRFWASLPFTLAVVALSMGAMRGLVPLAERSRQLLELVLTLPVVGWAAWPLLQRMARSIARRHPNMFTLIGMGVLVAFLTSALATLLPGLLPGDPGHPPIYFEAAAVIVSLTLLGQLLERRTHARAGQAIRKLLELAPEQALRLDAQGREESVAVSEIRAGDRLKILPSTRVPVDSVILEGSSSLDESMLTGESIPVERGPGELVVAGTMNLSAPLLARAEKVGQETVLARIVEAVRNAQKTRPQLERVADRVSRALVPAVIGAAAVAFLAWILFGPEPRWARAVLSAVSVLIVACPCALGLATPMTVLVASGRAARLGVLFRSADAFERLAGVTVLVFDKTGTLTEGRPRFRALELESEVNPLEEVLRLAAALASGSEHPLSRALLAEAERRGLELETPSSVKSWPGRGVVGLVGRRVVALGNEALLESKRIALPETLAAVARQQRLEGRSVLYVALDARVAGAISFEDPLRPEAAVALERLRQMGLELELLSGDSSIVVDGIARKLGLETARGGVLPEEKAARVAELQRAGKRVAMAGDGTNDAPALAQADCGIALGSGTDVALGTAHVALLSSHLTSLVRALELSRAAVRNMKQNLAWAFGYNLLAVPIAAGVLYPWTGWLLSPMLAAVLMTLSDLSVVGNALRLERVGTSGPGETSLPA